MVDRAAPRAADPPSVRRCPIRRQGHIQRCSEAAATDRLAPSRSAKAPAPRQHPLSDAEIVGGEASDSSCACPPRSALAARVYAKVTRPADGMLAARYNDRDFG